MATYQLENAHKTKLWMKVVAVLLAAVMVIGALVELLCQTSMVKNRLEVSAMMSGYTKDIVDTSKAAAIDKQTMAEDDKVLAVKNRDGSNTAYIFSEPIYYEDADGQIRTKDISIQKVKDKTCLNSAMTSRTDKTTSESISQKTQLSVRKYQVTAGLILCLLPESRFRGTWQKALATKSGFPTWANGSMPFSTKTSMAPVLH